MDMNELSASSGRTMDMEKPHLFYKATETVFCHLKSELSLNLTIKYQQFSVKKRNLARLPECWQN
jgi:hypothetical protein